jgi:Peptidase S46
MLKQLRWAWVALLCLPLLGHAAEGMWIPALLKSLNEAEMRSMGLRLSAEDIYSVNKSSLKDAVVHFGGGCTAEVVSPTGLIFTNHHCGFSQIQSHSSVEKDYLTDGFWAMSRDKELANPGLTATFIQRIEDVTKAVLEGTEGKQGPARQEVINATSPASKKTSSPRKNSKPTSSPSSTATNST